MISWLSIVFYEFKSWMLMITPGSYDLSYHRNFLMVFKAGCPPSVKRCDVMRWTIVPVYLAASKCLNQGNKDQIMT